MAQIAKEILERLSRSLGDSYHKSTDSVDREAILVKLRQMREELVALREGSLVTLKYSGKNYGVKNNAKGKLEVIKVFLKRLDIIGMTIAGKSVQDD